MENNLDEKIFKKIHVILSEKFDQREEGIMRKHGMKRASIQSNFDLSF